MPAMAAAGRSHARTLLALSALCLPALLMLTVGPFSQLAELRRQNDQLRQMLFDSTE